jgi:hypothetical protein
MEYAHASIKKITNRLNLLLSREIYIGWLTDTVHDDFENLYSELLLTKGLPVEKFIELGLDKIKQINTEEIVVVDYYGDGSEKVETKSEDDLEFFKNEITEYENKFHELRSLIKNPVQKDNKNTSLMLALSKGEVAILVKLLIESGVFGEKKGKQSNILRFLNNHFTTASNEGSEDSFFNLYYTPPPKSKATFEDVLKVCDVYSSMRKAGFQYPKKMIKK